MGFTLIELLIVVAIIGILAAIAVPNFMNARLKANISRTVADMRTVTVALEQYFLQWNSYVDDHDYPSDRSQRGLFSLTSPMPYLSSLPTDIFSSKVTGYTENNPHFEFGSGHATNPSSSVWPKQAYIIISPGPNRIEEVHGNDNFPFGTRILSFDVSNGLKSNGDIVRMGGNYNSGTIYVDGKRL